MTIDFGSRLYDLAWSTNICKMIGRLTHSSIERLGVFCQDAKPFHDVTTIKRSQGGPPYGDVHTFSDFSSGPSMVCRCNSPCGKAVAKSGPDASSLAILSMGHERCSIPGMLQWQRHRRQEIQVVASLWKIFNAIRLSHRPLYYLITSYLVFCCVFQQQMWSRKYQQVILRTKIYPNRAGCLMRTTWSKIWLTSGGTRIRLSSGQTVQCRSFARSRTSVWGLCWHSEVS